MFLSRRDYGFQISPDDENPRRRSLPREVRDHDKRERFAIALSAVVHDVGLPGLTVAAVLSQAKMSRATFYKLFDNREDALRFAFAFGNARLKKSIEDGAGGAGQWSKRVEAAIESLLHTVVDNPHLAELCLLQGRSVLDAAGPFDPQLVQTLAGVIRSGPPKGSRSGPGPRVDEFLAYGVLAVITERLRRDEADSLPGLAGELTTLVTMPFLDPGPLPSPAADR